MFTGIICLCIFADLKWIKVKKLFKNKYTDYRNYSSNYKMNIESLKINIKPDYDWDDVVYIYDINVTSVEIIKRESRIGINIYYI